MRRRPAAAVLALTLLAVFWFMIPIQQSPPSNGLACPPLSQPLSAVSALVAQLEPKLRCVDVHSNWRLEQLGLQPTMGPNTAIQYKGLSMVHHQHRIRYLQLPKTGSTSIKGTLASLGFVNELHGASGQRYLTINNYWTFTIVREPISRAISGFEEAHERNTLDWLPHGQNPTSEAYYSEWVQIGLFELYNSSRVVPSRMHHALPQTFFTTEVGGIPYRIDWLGRLEETQDWARLSGEVSQRTKGALTLPPLVHKHHAGPSQVHFAEWWNSDRPSAADRQAMCRFYAGDYTCFGYLPPDYCRDVVAQHADPDHLAEWWLRRLSTDDIHVPSGAS